MRSTTLKATTVFVGLAASLFGSTLPGHAESVLKAAEMTTQRVLARLSNGQPRCLPRLSGPVEAHVFYGYKRDGFVEG